MSRLPEEIWVQIASYIPRRNLKELYAVNSLFFRIAMDIRYNDLQLVYLTISDARLLHHLQNDHIANRVRSFSIDDAAVTALSNLTYQQKRFKRPSSSYSPSRALQIIRLLVRRSSYKLSNGDQPLKQVAFNDPNALCEKYSLVWPHFRLFWPQLGKNLRKLSIQAKARDLPRFLKYSSIPCLLEDLSITVVYSWRFLYKPAPKMATAKSMKSLLIRSMVTFINQQRGLRALSISISISKDVATLFAGLEHFPLLDRLSLYIDRLSDSSGLSRFLRAHSKNIQELSISPHIIDNFHSMNVFNLIKSPDHGWPDSIVFPNLQIFEIDLWDDVWGSTALAQTHALYTAVHTFRVIRRRLTVDEIDDMCAAFKRMSGKTSIQCLSFSTYNINKALIDVLSESIPTLRCLEICVNREAQSARAFVSEMRGSGACYAGWMLSDITISTKSEQGDNRPYELDAMKALALCVPSIRFFCGRPVDDIPSPYRS